jgi:hypothetical protein
MRISNKHSLCSFLLILALIPTIRAQAQVKHSSPPSRFTNFENSPVMVEELGETGHNVRNVSQKTITEFKMACVVTNRAKQTEVVYRFPIKKSNIQPGQSVGEIRVDSPSSSTLCAQRNSQLAVIEVTFSDGGLWNAPLNAGKP